MEPVQRWSWTDLTNEPDWNVPENWVRSSDCAQVEAARDAAIRERDEFQQMLKRATELKCATEARLDALARQGDLLKQIIIAWDADEDLEFSEAIDAAREALGFKPADPPVRAEGGE